MLFLTAPELLAGGVDPGLIKVPGPLILTLSFSDTLLAAVSFLHLPLKSGFSAVLPFTD